MLFLIKVGGFLVLETSTSGMRERKKHQTSPTPLHWARFTAGGIVQPRSSSFDRRNWDHLKVVLEIVAPPYDYVDTGETQTI